MDPPHPPGEPSGVTEVVRVAADHALVPSVRLTVAAGPDAGTSGDLSGERLVIGSHRSAGLVLSDATVSRFHCEVWRQGAKVLVRDLGSRNGTTLDGVPVREAFLRPGSVLSIGQSLLRADLGHGTVAVPHSAREHFGLMVGRSVAMRRVFSKLEKAAASDATVLLLGETGTGKEVAAESIHRESQRADGPFIVVDCGAIPAELLESELFGHDRGAFTGAVRAREGAFQAADGGTIFLDEIGELPKELQPKLLRALARRAVKPIGKELYVDVDVRVVAATNRDLHEEVNADRFRSDLYYRLAVIEVHLPPLRERPEDLAAHVDHMLGALRATDADRARLGAPGFLERLRRHRWSGNVRELRNHVERCLALGEQPALEDMIAVQAAGPDRAGPAVPVDLARPFKEARDEWTAAFERAYLAALLAEHGGNIRVASQAAGIDRVHMYRLLGKHGLR